MEMSDLYLEEPSHPYGIHELGNGRFLYAEKYMRQPNYGNAHSVVMHEMDYMGRVYKTFLHPNGFIIGRREKNTGNYLIAQVVNDHLQKTIMK